MAEERLRRRVIPDLPKINATPRITADVSPVRDLAAEVYARHDAHNQWQEQMWADQERSINEATEASAEEAEERDGDRKLARRDWEESRREREAMAAERAEMAEERRRMQLEREQAETDRQDAAAQREREREAATVERRRQFRRWIVATVLAVAALTVSIYGQVKSPPTSAPAVTEPAPAR